MPKYKVNGRTFNIPDNEVDLFEADFPEAQLHYQTNDGRKFTIYANERKDFLSDFPDATELGWSETIKEQAKQADPFQPEDNLAQPMFGSMSYQDNIGKPEAYNYYPSPLSEEGRADYEPISAEERSKQEYDMLMRQLEEFNAANGSMMDTYEAYEKAAKFQVNDGGFAVDTPERRYLDENSDTYHQRKMEKDELNDRIKNNSYFNQMRMAEADAANETVDAISNLMAQNEAENPKMKHRLRAKTTMAMNPRGSIGLSTLKDDEELKEYGDTMADLATAKRLYENTAQVYAAPINDAEDIFKKFGQGFGQRFDDADFWSMGIIGIADDINARAAFQKIQDKFGSVKEFANLTDAEIDALLTPSEQLLISAVMDNNAALYARKDNTAGAYEAGAGAADSLMFMAQFLLTGGIGDAATVGTAAHKRLVSWLGRKVGTMSNGLMKDVARGAVKLGVGTADSIGKALVMTPLMPHTYANIADKMMSFDDNGELMDTTDAIISGSIDALIETWSESTGDFVNKVLGVPGDITKGLAKKVLKNVDFSDWGRAMNAPLMKLLKQGGFNGFLGEMGEEFIGNATRSLIGTLAPGSGQDPEALKNFAQWEQLLITAGSFAPMTIFGIGTSSAQYGLAKRKLNNAQKAFESMLREASYTEDQTRFIIDELLGSTDAHLTPERLVANFSPLLRELAFNDRFANNRTQAMQSAVDFMWQIARYRTFDGVYHRQEEQQRNDMLTEIQEGTGREFWTTRLSENAGLDGTAYETDEVRAVEFNDGRVAYVLGGDGVNNTVVYNDGQTGFLSEEQLNEGKANGSIISDATMGLNDYLTQRVARVRMTEEEQRMFAERNTNIGQVRAQFPIDATVELGTTEAPIQGIVRQQTPNGVIVESPAGVSQLTWEELGHTIGIEVNPQTDAQMEEEAINNLEIADLQRRRERERRRTERNAEAEAVLAEEQMVDEAENEGLEKPIPMKADGTVDQTAFWNESPARWAQWKTEQRQDGGAYASTYIQNAIGILESQIAESEAAFLAESDFDTKDALEQAINQQRARLAELQDLAMQYMPSVIPTETSAENAEEQTRPGAETSQPAAVMADRQKFELDAEYQRRLSLAKTLEEKEMILKEYFEAISAGSMEAVVMNKQNYKQVMKENGCDEAAIEEVTNAIKEAEEEHTAVDALHANDKIFVIAEYNYTIENGRVSYVHERQHNITKRNPDLIQRVLSLGLSRETLQKIVRTLSGTTFYDKKSDEVLADEILSSTMEIAYTFDDFSVTLSKLGLPIELINLINQINDEQRNDFTLANARRNTLPRNDRQGSSRQDVGDQGEVSGGILGEEGDGSQETGLRGTESGEPATGGAEASEEGLQVPLAEVEEESEEEPNGPDFRVTKPEDNLSDETKKELADKGLVMDGGAIMSEDYAELKHELGYETPIERNTDLDDLRFSYGTRHAHIANYLQHPEAEQRVVDLLERLAERLSMNELVFGVISKATKHTYGKKLPGSVAGPLRSNVEYVITFDLDTSCPRTFQYLNLVKRIERRIGRPLTQTECIQLIEMMRMYGQQIPCVYCYAENKRQALKQYYTDFIEARHGVLSAATDEEALGHMYGHTKEQSNDPKVALTDAAYNVFVEWRKNPKGMYNPTIKMLWYQYTNDRNSILSLLDTMLEDKGISIDATDAKIAASVAAEFGVTNAKAIKVIEEIVAEWKWDVIEGKDHDQYTPMDEDDWGVNERALEVWRDMTAYAKSASSAKSVIRYTPYTDELKEISQEDKDYINGMGGVRMHSSNDFRIDYVFDYFQFMADMALYKMFGHTYTKSPEFVRIFGNSGYKINMSIAAYQDENGKIRPNADEGFEWEEAKTLRQLFPNAGTMLMATSDEQIQMALDSDWIDMCIPFHHSGLPKAVWYNMRMWQDYTSIQKELFLNSSEMKDALKADGVIIPKKAKADEIANLYNEHFNVKVIYNKKGKRIRPHFLPGPTVVDGNTIPGHNNDHQRYLDLCREYGVKPRFAGMQVRDNSPEGGGRVIDVTEHPRYMIFIKETARTDSPQTAIQFNFDEASEALGGKTPMEYAFDELEARAMAESELEGSPVKDIYNSLNKDQFGIADKFVSSIIKHKEQTGEDYPLDYLTPESREWFLVQRKALEEAFKDVETIPYHRNEYDEQGNLTQGEGLEREDAIDLVEEAKKADLRHRMSSENTLVPGHKKGQPMLSDAEMMADVRFRTTEIIPEVREEMAKIKESAERNGTYLKAPNGQPTNLTPEQWMMVRTEGFKFWFGDWENDPENASKVVDENGEPMVVYHGTQSKFTAFDVGYKGKNFVFRLSEGFYFSPDETVAESYASFPDELKTGEVKAVFLKIINPFYIKSAKDYREQIKEIVSLAAGRNRYQADLLARMSESELLSQRGYDGVVEKRTDNITGEIVVFDPNQIKSATDNTGVFSVYDDIRFRVTAEQDKAYMDAVKAGDMEAAQRMVDEAAEAAGYSIRGDHGRVSKFTIFDRDKANPEGNWGQGFYFTNNEEDVENNYASVEGPDLEAKIEREVERRVNLAEMNEEFNEDGEVDEFTIREAVEDEFITSEPNVVHAAIKMDNPFVVGHGMVEIGEDGLGHYDMQETYLTAEYETDEDGEVDYSIDPTGTLVDLVEALNDELSEYEGVNINAYDILSDNIDGMTASQFEKEARELLGNSADYLLNDDLEIMTSEIIRAAIERAGFDGIVDNTVNQKFGTARRFGRAMEGMDENTRHYIAFQSNQIKETDPVTYDDNGNVIPLSERFNPEKDDIRFRTVYHGTAAKFEKFDHAHMGEGEGAQAYGWGTYVTEVPGIGKTYAIAMRDKRTTDTQRENAIVNKLAADILNAANGNRQEALNYLYGLLQESWSDKKRVKKEIKIITTGRNLPEAKAKAYLYTVEIPDNGIYIQYEQQMDSQEEIIDSVIPALEKDGWQKVDNTLLEKEDKKIVINTHATGGDFYAELSYALGSDANASHFLKRAGIIGISYPAQNMSGGRADAKRNFVIFDEEDLEIVETVRFRMRRENESAEEFIATEIPRFQGSYNVNAPIILMDYSSKESAARSLGIDVKDMPDYMYDNIKELAKENGGAYVKELNTILIFAQDYITTSGKADNVFFHEGTHSFITENPHWLTLGEWLLDNAASGTKKKIADVVRMAYEEDEYVEEMLSSYTGLMLSLGRSQAVMNSLPTEMKPIWEEILNKFNYIPEYEDTRRKSERAGDEDARRDAGVPMRNTDGEKAVRKGKISWKQPAGLTSKERRVINEYFPGAFRMTDSKGNTLTPAQEEFFANSKAVDKDGNLLVLYHGTPRAGFTEFESGWFTTSKEDAISYSGDRKGRMFDPNEKYEPETLVAGDFPLGYMTFDSEEDRAAFLAEHPEAESAISEAEFDSMALQADEEYDDLIARKPELKKIWDAYREYERERFVDTTIGDIISNPEAYTEEDLMRAMLAYDSNASLDSLDDMDAEERKDALVSALRNADEETEGGIADIKVATRVPRNGEGVKHNDLGNRTYEVYANVENPYEIDANGRGSEFESGDIYKSVEEALADEQYDGVIIRNWRVGRTQQLGDVVVPKNGSQIKLTINENPTELDDIRFSIRTKPAPKKTGKGYKVFYLKDSKLYPPMVANLGGVDTPVGVWLDAEEGTRAGVSKTGRPQVKQGGKGTQGGSGTLAYRPGWHLGEIPYAIQFNRKDENGDRTLFPADFVWAEVEYANDVDYQEEAMSYGMNANGKFQHSLAGLPKIPTDGSYKYRTNPNPETDPWIITGSMKVNRLLTPSEVDQMVIDAGREPQKRQEGAVTDGQIEALNKDLGLVEEEEEVSIRTTGTPTEDVVAEGVSLSPAQLASLAGDIFAALPEESRKKITDGLNGNILGLQDAILQIPTSLATKEDWNDEDRQMAEVVAEQMTKVVGKEMTRPFSASEALWTLYNAVNKPTDLVSEASRALVRRNLGFDSQTLEMEKEAKDGVRFRTVGNASANAQASMYNRGAANVWTRLKESYVDMHASVEELVKAIEKRSGKVAQGFENILMALNQQSSKGLAAMEAYEQKFLNKMFDAIRKIMDKTDFKYEDIVRYVILKHGLERNVKMAQRDAKAHYQEIYDDIIAKIKGMNPAQKRTYLTNAQLRDADAKAELARLQAVNTSILTPDQLTDYKKEIAKAKKEAADAAEHLVRAQKIATLTEQDAQDELDKIFDNITNESDSVYQEMRENDYSGISSMFYDTLGVDRKNYATEEEYQAALMQAKADKYDNLGDIEGAAQMEVTLFENTVNTDNLWKSINKATKETLRQQYDANMISKDQYLNLRDMFEYYVPLRGFADNTAEDMYTYYRRPNSTGYTKPILGAEGRKTEAESPFGWIAAMAGSAIASNVKNEAKLALYYFVANRPDNGIATLSKTWFVHTPGDVDANGKKIFRPAYPPFNEDLSSDSAKADYEIWQANMRNLQEQGLAYESGQRLNLGNSVVNISDTNKPEHIVNVKVGGKDYTIVINGNPRAAQAINGDLNIESSAQDYGTVFGPVLRWMSSVNTSYNPEFWITNMMRDMAFTMMAVNIKEDPAYRRKFKKNYAKAFKVISMVAKNEKGTLGNSYIENMYKDFVKYGGVTGYTQIKDSETWEKEIENYLASNDPASIRSGKVMRGMKSAFHAAHRFGESLEQVSRFAAFLTAVETGKSINEAINDAKEITVNFNRKGSGKMITLEEAKYLTDNNGQPLNKFEQWAAVGLSSIAPLGRRFIMFFNAAIQGLNATYKLYAKNKTRAIGWALGYAAVGMMNAVLHAMLDDDDDYLDIPQYERRNSLMIGGNGAYFKWALPQEARAFYALGDLAVESVMGRNPHQSVIGEALKISTEILPVNPSEGWKAFMPSVAIPLVELALNEDYKGAPIYNEQKWLTEEERKRSTKWSKAYSGTGDPYIGIAKALNAISGGDEHDAGLINLQPEKMQHIVQSAFGGTIRTADKLFTTIMAAFDPEEDVTVRQFPFLNRFLTINDERFKNVHVNDVYDYYAAEAEHTISLQKKYTKDRNADALKDLRSSDEYKWARIYSKYKKPIKKYQEAIRAADTTNERMELMKQQDELKRKMIKEISEL